MRTYKFKNESMTSLVEGANAEKLTYVMTHPYYGLRDSQGWLTRYPADQVVWSRGQVKSYLSGGASFDSCEVWGCDPTSEAPSNWVGKLHILSRLIKAYGRWDWLPIYRGEEAFPLHESIDLTSYFRLCVGYDLKLTLEYFGVQVNNSLFTLAKADEKWIARKIQKHSSFESIVNALKNDSYRFYFKNEPITLDGMLNVTDSKNDNSAFAYARKCRFAYRLKNLLRKPMRHVGYTKEIQSKRLANINYKSSTRSLYASHRNKRLGVFYATNLKSYYTSVGSVNCDGRNVYVSKDEGGHCYINGQVKYTAKTVNDLNVLKIKNVWFVWNPMFGFEDHVESNDSLQVALTTYRIKRTSNQEKEEILRSGVITLRQFRLLTGSCFPGTLNFLRDNMPHIARLLEPFQDSDRNGYGYQWRNVLASDLADVEWHLSEEAIDKIRHRF